MKGARRAFFFSFLDKHMGPLHLHNGEPMTSLNAFDPASNKYANYTSEWDEFTSCWEETIFYSGLEGSFLRILMSQQVWGVFVFPNHAGQLCPGSSSDERELFGNTLFGWEKKHVHMGVHLQNICSPP